MSLSFRLMNIRYSLLLDQQYDFQCLVTVSIFSILHICVDVPLFLPLLLSLSFVVFLVWLDSGFMTFSAWWYYLFRGRDCDKNPRIYLMANVYGKIIIIGYSWLVRAPHLCYLQCANVYVLIYRMYQRLTHRTVGTLMAYQLPKVTTSNQCEIFDSST